MYVMLYKYKYVIINYVSNPSNQTATRKLLPFNVQLLFNLKQYIMISV